MKLIEGINDKNIFKAVFLAGGAGSGKSFITSKVFGYDGKVAVSPMGAKILNSDFFFERFLKKEDLSFVIDMTDVETYEKQTAQRRKAKDKVNLQQNMYIDGMLPLIIDGTGRDVEKIVDTKTLLEQAGYDTAMIFVNTSLEVALERNAKRDRKVDAKLATDMWYEIQNNIGIFQREFGNSNFYIIDNSEILTGKEYDEFELYLFKLGEKILTQPLQNPIGKRIVQQLRSTGGKYISDLIKENTQEKNSMVTLKEGQKVLDEDGNLYEIEKGDSLQESKLSSSILRDYEKRANAERNAGSTVEINHRLPYVAVTLSGGDEYFFQGEEASDLLDEVPDNINEEDYILAVAQGW